MLVHQAVADPPRDHPWAVCCASSSLASSPAATGCHRRAAGQSLVGVQALQLIIASTGPAFAPELDPELRMLLLKALLHPNRFVRETAYHCLAEACALLPREQLLAQAPSFCERLCDGLVENWSQVRTLAGEATVPSAAPVGRLRSCTGPSSTACHWQGLRRLRCSSVGKAAPHATDSD